MSDQREPKDVQLLRHPHHEPTLQFNDKEPLATVPTDKEARPRGGEASSSDAARAQDRSHAEHKPFPAGEQPPRAADDIPSNTAAFPPKMNPLEKAAGETPSSAASSTHLGSGLSVSGGPRPMVQPSHGGVERPAPVPKPCCQDDDENVYS